MQGGLTPQQLQALAQQGLVQQQQQEAMRQQQQQQQQHHPSLQAQHSMQQQHGLPHGGLPQHQGQGMGRAHSGGASDGSLGSLAAQVRSCENFGHYSVAQMSTILMSTICAGVFQWALISEKCANRWGAVIQNTL